MGRFQRKGGNHHHDDGASDISELSHDDGSSIVSNMSKSSAFRAKFLRGGKFGKKNKSNGTASVGSASRSRTAATSANGRNARNGARSRSRSGSRSRQNRPKSRSKASPSPRRGGARSVDGRGDRSVASAKSAGARSAGAAGASRAGGGGVDQKRLIKDAKSRFNIGLVYLKTGDYAKAQDNLEHSLYCHIQLNGHDSKMYTNESLFAVAGVREKLGECYLANTSVVDKCLSLDHYEESKRLLKSVDPEDAPDNLKEMLERVEEQLKSPELASCNPRRKPPPATSKYQMEGNKKAKALMGVGTGARAAAAAGAGSTGGGSRGGEARAYGKGEKSKNRKNTLDKVDVLGLGKGLKTATNFIHDFAEDVKDKLDDAFDTSSDGDTGSKRSSLSGNIAEGFDIAMSHLERDNHRTALNYLSSLQEEASMRDENFRAEMAFCMLKVADGALEGEKISVATDAYEEAYSVLKQDQAEGENMENAMKGCVKCHKLLAIETEGMRDYSSGIGHRSRVYQLLDENNKCVPACNQLLKIAYLHGLKDDYAKGTVSLTDAIRRLSKGVRSIDLMPADRMKLLIQCYHMRAIFYTKNKKWNEAIDQYDELMPLINKVEGQGGDGYNSALIHKSALLVTMGNHRLAQTSVQKYLQLAELSDEMAGNLIVSDLDHVLALDTSAATYLKMGNVDKAISIFQHKLKFVKTLPDNEELTSDTMHKLGCLMAHKNEHEIALPLLNEALTTRKYLYDGKHRSVFETTWAVAATNHTLGDNEKALKEYGVLLEKMGNIQDLPVDSVLIHNSAGKLFFEDGKLDKAAHSYQMALRGLETSQNTSHNPQLKAEITLNLANVMSARGETDKAMDLYDQLLGTKSLKRTKIFFLTLFNKSLLLIKIGEADEAKEILTKVGATRTSLAVDVKPSVYLTEGNLLIADGKVDEAMECFEKALEATDDEDIKALVHTKNSIANAYIASRQTDKAIETLEDVLEDLSSSGVDGKSVELLKAEIWNSLSRVYKKNGDLSQAKNYAKLALQTYKSELGENNPITLRNVSNLQLLLLEEAEELPKGDAKSIIDAAKYEMEGTLDAFVSLNDTWTYRLDVASLKTNLGLVAIWQGKPKKAKKLLRQIQEIEVPPEHSLVQRIEVLEIRVQELEKKKGK